FDRARALTPLPAGGLLPIPILQRRIRLRASEASRGITGRSDLLDETEVRVEVPSHELSASGDRIDVVHAVGETASRVPHVGSVATRRPAPADGPEPGRSPVLVLSVCAQRPRCPKRARRVPGRSGSGQRPTAEAL